MRFYIYTYFQIMDKNMNLIYNKLKTSFLILKSNLMVEYTKLNVHYKKRTQ